MNIDIGCGSHKTPGFVGIDREAYDGVDIVHDLNYGLPIHDNSVDLVLASHILEHLPDTVEIMREIWRVCKHGSQVAISVPYYKSIGAWQDPTHVRAFTEATFYYWDPEHPLYGVYRWKERFKVQSIQWATAGNLEVVLVALKDGDIEKNQETALRGENLDKAIKRAKPRRQKKKSDAGI